MVFNKIAERYNAWYKTPFGKYADKLEKDLVLHFIDPVKGMNILDIGSGTGNYSALLANRAANVVGLDSSPGMLHVAKKKTKQGEGDVDFILGDAENLPLKNQSFDAAVSVTSLCFIENFEKVVYEMRRIVKSSGKIVVGDLNKWSLYGIGKKLVSKFKESVYREAKFHSISELKYFFHKVKWDSTLFALPWMPNWLLKIFAQLEKPLSRLLKPFGAFIVLRIKV